MKKKKQESLTTRMLKVIIYEEKQTRKLDNKNVESNNIWRKTNKKAWQ